MRSTLDCLPCFVRQALTSARAAGADPDLHEQAVRGALELLHTQDLDTSPPAVAQRMHRHIRELAGDRDPFAAMKRRADETMLRLLPDLRRHVLAADDPFTAALRLAIAGNTIDVGVGDRDTGRIEEQLEAAADGPLAGDIEELRRSIDRAERLLYLCDNAGEIVLDALFAESLPLEKVTFVVRGAPVLNDALMADAEVAGLTRLAPVVDNGSDGPGTILDDCSPAFRQLFADADLIIAKGQGNFETLNEEPAAIRFLFLVKCPVVADHTGLPVGTQVLLRADRSAR